MTRSPFPAVVIRVVTRVVTMTLCLAWPIARAWCAPSAPPGFSIATLAPQLRFNLPTCLAFLPDGRLLVGEKAGRVYLVTNGIRSTRPLWDGQREVLNSNDAGLIGVAVDPHYFVDHYVYFSYVVDPDSDRAGAAPHGASPSSVQDAGTHGFGRLVRYTMSATDTNALDLESRVTLIGADWPGGPVTTVGMHTIDALRFGADGSLLVAVGDGSDAGKLDAGCGSCPDGYDPIIFGDGRTDPLEDIGAFRAQDPNSLCGKILRIDPATGLGLPDNPHFDGDPRSVASRVWASGLRNPYRFTVRPGTGGPGRGPGALYIGDVGWLSWEEIDVAAGGGSNFGWPCYEGIGDQISYQNAHPARYGCSRLDLSLRTGPLITWSHTDSSISTPPIIAGNCVTAGAFYTGARYPDAYRGRFFYADYGRNWLRTVVLDSLNRPSQFQPFASDLDGPVDFAIDPTTGDLCYAAINVGEIRRIAYTGAGNLPPVALASAAPDSGRAPLAVRFSSAGSADPEGSRLTFRWAFGDRGVSDDPTPEHVFDGSGIYAVVLAVSDSLGATGSDTIRVTVTGPRRFPSTASLDAFTRADGPLGAAWSGADGLAIVDSAAVATAPGSHPALWNGRDFDADQEAWYTLRALGAGAAAVVLEARGATPDDGAIVVRYAPATASVEVATSAPGAGWSVAGTIDSVALAPGDVFGARVYRGGLVQVFRNRAEIGEIALPAGVTPAGGRAGLVLDGPPGTMLDDFGAGTILEPSNVPPVATITSPRDGSFYAAGDTIRLAGSAVDENGAPRFRWQVDTHHNNHIHPATFVSNQPSDYFVGEAHDDGTGVFLRARLVVSDAGLSDTASVDLYPEVDLVPTAVVVTPLADSARFEYRFALANHGRMLAPFSHWVLQSDGVEIARGDTIVQPRDSVAVVVQAEAPPQGEHTLRLTVDSLATVHETNETNDARVQTVVGPNLWARLIAAPPSVRPLTMAAVVSWVAKTSGLGVVYFGTSPALGDSVVARRDTTVHRLVLRDLRPGTSYYYAVSVPDADGNYHLGPLSTFMTQDIPAAVALSPPFPNPSRDAIQFTVELPQAGRVRLRVFDLAGRAVWSDRERNLPAGTWRLRWPGTSAAGASASAGVYLARVAVDDREFVRRVLIVR